MDSPNGNAIPVSHKHKKGIVLNVYSQTAVQFHHLVKHFIILALLREVVFQNYMDTASRTLRSCSISQGFL